MRAETLEAWTLLMADLPADVTKRAVVDVLRTQQGAWWPTPGEIRARVAVLTGHDTPSAEEAWGLIMTAVRRYGWMQPREAIASLPSLVAAVASDIGWMELCESDPEIMRGQFRALWESRAQRERNRAARGEAPIAHPLPIPSGDARRLTATRAEPPTAFYDVLEQMRQQGVVPDDSSSAE